MESLQDTVLDQIISTYPDDVLIRCWKRIMNKLNSKNISYTIVCEINPRLNGYFSINREYSDYVKAMKLVIKFLMKLLIDNQIKLVKNIEDYIEMVTNNPDLSYLDFLGDILNKITNNVYSNIELRDMYEKYVIVPILLHFKHVFDKEESQYLLNSLEVFITELDEKEEIPNDLDFNQIFDYKSVKLFDYVVHSVDCQQIVGWSDIVSDNGYFSDNIIISQLHQII